MSQWSLPPEVVRQSLSVHSILAVSVLAIIYWLCLSGSIAVFGDYFERWQNPQIEEFSAVDGPAIERGVLAFSGQFSQTPESIYAVLPTDSLPRMHIAADVDGVEHEYFTTADGQLTAALADGWVQMLRHLHASLLLPEIFGVIIVGIFGVFLLAIILTGVFAHPKMFRDAFRLKLGGKPRSAFVDLHNRLSVWGLPFHLMTAVTGAYFGIVSLLVVASAAIDYDGDREQIIDHIFGADPVFEKQFGQLDVTAALSSLADYEPQATPIYMVFHHLGSEAQFIEIAATLPNRLVYSEMYRFSIEGDYIDSQQLSAGPVGRQIAYSVYRLHFGAFGPLVVKWAYLLLGLALTYVCVSGVNIWLAKRNRADRTEAAWVATIWATPSALLLSLLVGVFYPTAVVTSFFAGFTLMVVAAVCYNNIAVCRRLLQLSCGVFALLTVILYSLIHHQYWQSSVIITINLSLLAIAVLCLSLSRRSAVEQQSGLRPIDGEIVS
jgi:uncharacterized iron-regulated membrane protein